MLRLPELGNTPGDHRGNAAKKNDNQLTPVCHSLRFSICMMLNLRTFNAP